MTPRMTLAALLLSASRWSRPRAARALLPAAPASTSGVPGRRRRRSDGPPSCPLRVANVEATEEGDRPAASEPVDVAELAAKRARKKESLAARRARGRERRRKFVGLAKAVDRGAFTAYRPGGPDGTSFEAKSGLPDSEKEFFVVLGIESSCDDTGAAVVRSDGTILGESLASQHAIHEEWGGMVPGLAKATHEENIDRVVCAALADADMSMEDVDAVGATVGPGLEICLRVGCDKGRELATRHRKPFVGAHHLEARVLMARIPQEKYGGDGGEEVAADGTTSSVARAAEFPFLALLVSGGHCQILKCLGIGRYSVLGGTLDDSLGEAFDKTARLLGLPVGGGGGPAVEALARDGNPKAVPLPIPLQRRKDCDFSYAGLKTAVRLAAERTCADRGAGSTEDLSREDKADLAASFQHVAFRHVEVRLGRAMERVEREDGIRTLAVVGGVAANAELRRRLDALCSDRDEPWTMLVPPPRLCTDQGAMSAWAAVERLTVGSSDRAEDQEVFARYPFSAPTDD
ncbi:hypothetical protein ACHAWF_005406 [Thalassiosira exigua]